MFGLHIMLARLLGPEQYGIYIYAFTWIHILLFLCLLGFHTSLLRFVAEYHIKQQWSLLRGILRRSRQIVLSVSILAALVGTGVVWFSAEDLSAEQVVTFYAAFCLLPVLTFAWLREASLRALKHAVQAELLQRVVYPALTGLGVLILFFRMGSGFTARYAMTVNLGSILVTAAIGTFLLYRMLPKSVLRTRPDYADRRWLSVSLPLLLIAGMHIVLKRTDIVMVGAMKGTEEAGIYSAASRVSDLVVFALMAINSILAPMISELYHTGQKKRLQRIITLAARAIFIFTLMSSLLLILFGKFILTLFGTVFAAAYVPLMILLAGQVANSLTGSVGFIMSMSGKQNMMGLIITISAVVNILLNFLLVPLFGRTGAAVSTAVCLGGMNLVAAYVVWVQLGLWTIPVVELPRRRTP